MDGHFLLNKFVTYCRQIRGRKESISTVELREISGERRNSR